MKFELDIPETADVQLVFRLQRAHCYEATLPNGYTFSFINTVSDALTEFSALKAQSGLAWVMKCLIRLSTKKRAVYVIMFDGKVASIGGCAAGICKHYRIEKNAMAIGPIETVEAHQGKGLASIGMQLAMNEYIVKGIGTFYIDTQRTNTAAQKTFAKCGFGSPIALYWR
jgi:RimJ/RimL family protein N-acetyltransferase